jgi:hypothetical protein
LGAGLALFAALAEGLEQSGALGSEEAGELVGHLIGLLIAGALFGIAQRHVLQRYGAGMGWTVLVAGAGLWLGYGLSYTLLGFPFDYILGPGLAAALAAAAQSAALRLRGARAGWWVAANALGFIIGSLPGLAIAFLGLGEAIGSTYLGWIALNALMGAINGAVGAAITGTVLLRLARRAAPDAALTA